MKKTIVISLGGSLIIPEKVNFTFLHRFKKELRKNYSKYKFVVVCGGGTTARKYIQALLKEGKSKKQLSFAGIMATRENAKFMMQFFGKESNDKLPESMEEVKDALPKNKVVICGALRYTPNSTSDGTAAKLAQFLKTDFINMTNVKGLYDKNPKEYKNAKFISEISWDEFEKKTLAIKYKAGQNFVLDQSAAVLIKKQKIKTYIIGPDVSGVTKIVKGKKFVGTIIVN